MLKIRGRKTSSSPRKATVVLVAVAGLVATSLATALAAPSPTPPPAPTITSGPTGPTTSTTAAFTYTSTQLGVTFQCKLDGGSFSSCPTSGKSYSGLNDGSHTFSVAAQKGSGPLSSPATRTWLVDTAAPALVTTFPGAGGSYNTGQWDSGCEAGPGVCGTATDLSGVAAVEVAFYQGSNPNPTFGEATLGSQGGTSTSWHLSLPVPADGPYTVRIRARDVLGTTTPNGTQPRISFQVENVPPPTPEIVGMPDDPTTNRNARFDVVDSEPGVTFECRLDGTAFETCGATVSFNDLSQSRHCFEVRAVDPAGNRSPAESYCWTIVLDGGFPITGDLDEQLYPGATRSLNLVLGNPNNFTIRVTSVTITVDPRTSQSGCAGDENLTVTQDLAVPVDVPANSTRSLEQLGVAEVSWPKLTMPNKSFNQDACKNASFDLHYSGQATRP